VAAPSAPQVVESIRAAWLLSQELDTTPEFWTNLQANRDLALNRPDKKIDKLRLAS